MCCFFRGLQEQEVLGGPFTINLTELFGGFRPFPFLFGGFLSNKFESQKGDPFVGSLGNWTNAKYLETATKPKRTMNLVLERLAHPSPVRMIHMLLAPPRVDRVESLLFGSVYCRKFIRKRKHSSHGSCVVQGPGLEGLCREVKM